MQDHRNLGHVASPAEIASLASLVARKLASPPVFVGAAQPRVVSATTASAAAQHAASGAGVSLHAGLHHGSAARLPSQAHRQESSVLRISQIQSHVSPLDAAGLRPYARLQP